MLHTDALVALVAICSSLRDLGIQRACAYLNDHVRMLKRYHGSLMPALFLPSEFTYQSIADPELSYTFLRRWNPVGVQTWSLIDSPSGEDEARSGRMCIAEEKACMFRAILPATEIVCVRVGLKYSFSPGKVTVALKTVKTSQMRVLHSYILLPHHMSRL